MNTKQYFQNMEQKVKKVVSHFSSVDHHKTNCTHPQLSLEPET